ncbi:hypothetical protein B0H14DRAFT_1392886 [Mycena olivaceomarginata]|nr:hypothetical protein B0H14DRAFT_1392886 [Mycena olivaceomarginata]
MFSKPAGIFFRSIPRLSPPLSRSPETDLPPSPPVRLLRRIHNRPRPRPQHDQVRRRVHFDRGWGLVLCGYANAGRGAFPFLCSMLASLCGDLPLDRLPISIFLVVRSPPPSRNSSSLGSYLTSTSFPVRPDLVDLPAKIEWARVNDAEAHRIQETDRLFAEQVLTDTQNGCYWFAVLMGWGALWGEDE